VLAALALAALLGGCAASTTYRTLAVEVRDQRTGAPVPGALVHARSLSFYLPAPPYGIVDPAPPRSARGVTAEDGSVELEVIDGHPVELVIVHAGHAPAQITIDAHPRAPGPWLATERSLEDADGPQLEVRLTAR
jgi:hypothetical protein